MLLPAFIFWLPVIVIGVPAVIALIVIGVLNPAPPESGPESLPEP